MDCATKRRLLSPLSNFGPNSLLPVAVLLGLGTGACDLGGPPELGKSTQAIIECNGNTLGQVCDTDDDPCSEEICVQQGPNVFCSLQQSAPNGTACLSDNEACTADTCQLGVCEHTPLAENTLCDDGMFCTEGDRCSAAGICGGGPSPCEDDNECTADSCDEAGNTCNNIILPGEPCDDDACSVGSTCDAQGQCDGGYARFCDDGSSCTSDTCDSLLGCLFTIQPNSPCMDSLFCTIAESCSFSGECEGEANCNDGNVCTADTCDEGGQSCENTVTPGANCNDGNECTEFDDCSPLGLCQGQPVADGLPCSGQGGCLLRGTCQHGKCEGGLPVPDGTDCNDNSACTDRDTCAGGACDGNPFGCFDSDPCTADGCDAITGCFHTPIENCPATPDDADVPDAGAVPRDAGADSDSVPADNDAGPRGVLGGGGCGVAHRTSFSSLLLLLLLFGARGGRLRRRRVPLILSGLLLVVAVAKTSEAQGFDSELFKPASSNTAFFSQGTAEVLPALAINLGVGFGVATDPLVLRDPDTGEALMNGDVVSRRIGAYLSGGVGLWDFLEVGIAVPIVLNQQGQGLSSNRLESTSIGDLRSDFKLQILNRSGFAVAGFAALTAPLGDANAFIGSRGMTVAPALLVSARRGRFLIAANLGVVVRRKSTVNGLLIDDEATAGIGTSFEIWGDKAWLVGEAYAKQSLHQRSAESTPSEALFGTRLALYGPWQVQTAAGFGIGKGYGTPAFRGLLELHYAHREVQAAVLSAESPPRPKEPAPVQVKKVRRDGDGDGDGDGIRDSDDQCPTDPEDVDGFEDHDGCPEFDNDGDGLADADDGCPMEPEVINGIKDEDGCPDEGIIVMVKDRIVLGKRVLFDKNRIRVKSEGRKALKAIITLYKQHPEWGPMHIEGHADKRGSSEFNMWLSTRRSDRVRQEMIGFGMPADKISSEGLGDTQPRANGKSDEAMSKNRRVEFLIINDREEVREIVAPGMDSQSKKSDSNEVQGTSIDESSN